MIALIFVRVCCTHHLYAIEYIYKYHTHMYSYLFSTTLFRMQFIIYKDEYALFTHDIRTLMLDIELKSDSFVATWIEAMSVAISDVVFVMLIILIIQMVAMFVVSALAYFLKFPPRDVVCILFCAVHKSLTLGNACVTICLFALVLGCVSVVVFNLHDDTMFLNP